MIIPREKSGIWTLALRLSLGGVFLWAGVTKVFNPTDLLVAIYEYELGLPESLIRALAVILPWIEVLCGLSIMTGVWRETGLTLSALMLAVFLLATGQAWIRGLEISCGCFGALDEGGSLLGSVQFAFFRNLFLLGAAIYLHGPGTAWRNLRMGRSMSRNSPTGFPIILE